MKYFITLFISFLALHINAQVPVLGPINGPNSACSSPGPSVTYSVSASNSPTSYSWTVASATPGAIVSNPTASVTSISFPFSNGTYTLYCYAINNFGPSLIQTKVVSVFETPQVSFSGSNTFCQGSSTFLSASATVLMASPTINYFWSPPSGLNTTFGQFVIANPSVNTVYTVTAILGGCSGTSTIAVFPLPSPTLSIAASATSVCSGDPLTLTASGASAFYSWTGGVVNGVPFTPQFSGSYGVFGYNTNGCSSNSVISIVVKPSPTISVLSSTNNLCQGQSATITIGGNAITYSLNSNLVSNTVVVAPMSNVVYTISGTNSQGCTGTAILPITVGICNSLNEYAYEKKQLFFTNPSSNGVMLKSPHSGRVIIYTVEGKIVREADLESNKELYIEGLHEGIYFLRFGSSSFRLIVTSQ